MRSRLAGWLVPLSLLLSCASKPPRDLLVTSFTGRSGEDAAEPIRFRFNRAVVGADKVGVKLGSPPVTIAPLVPIEARWEDPQTLAIVPTGALAPSTLDTPANRKEMPTAKHDTWVKPTAIAELIVAHCSLSETINSGVVMPVYGKA